ncbi:MAG TPA: sigma-70 family RNA polymerase sigma factor, partial [Acidimicrobiales bacterium]
MSDATTAALRAAAASGDNDRLAALVDPLAARAAAGDGAALERLLWAVDELALARPAVRALVVEQADVDDILQDVLVAVAETIGGFRGEARFRTWLNQVARFKAIAHLRRRRDEVRLDDDRAGAGSGGVDRLGDAARISSILAERATLHGVLDGLPAHYREAVVLRDVHQLSYEQISERLG